jgi:class 3 adenylate cyclase
MRVAARRLRLLPPAPARLHGWRLPWGGQRPAVFHRVRSSCYRAAIENRGPCGSLSGSLVPQYGTVSQRPARRGTDFVNRVAPGRARGDGVLTYFGYPRAHEDDAERSVRAGWRWPRRSESWRFRRVPRSGSGWGIATGLVVVGDLIGTGETRERGVVGETPNLPARLQAFAEPDSTIISRRNPRRARRRRRRTPPRQQTPPRQHPRHQPAGRKP